MFQTDSLTSDDENWQGHQSLLLGTVVAAEALLMEELASENTKSFHQHTTIVRALSNTMSDVLKIKTY
jgi:hypothetical protein